MAIETVDFSKTLIHCSSAAMLLSNPKDKTDKEAGNLSETAKTYLIDIFIREKYKRRKDITNRYIQKGLMVEEDSITLYSRIKKTYFKKYTGEPLKNQFLIGTPDLFTGTDIMQSEMIIDVKSSWDIFTFFGVCGKKINPMYYCQLQMYMALTGAKSARLAYCLINTPEMLISDEKRKLMYKMNCVTNESPEYLEACVELEKSLKYDDMPLRERLIEFDIERDEMFIQTVYSKIIKARQFLKTFNEELILKQAA